MKIKIAIVIVSIFAALCDAVTATASTVEQHKVSSYDLPR